eukprot:c22578_g2_i1 orf=62-721(+)
MANAVQTLYEACQATFCQREALHSSLALQPVRSQLDCIKPCDVGLDENFFSQLGQGFGFSGTLNDQNGWYSSVNRWCPPISYIHIYECDDFSMGIFCLPTSAVIPLHDHPGMTVLSKLLYGSMHVKAYDWIGTSVQMDQLQLLDILVPPYSTLDGRDCTYYRDFPYSSHYDGPSDNWDIDSIKHGLAWLKKLQFHDDFVLKTAPYRGPRIVCREGFSVS